MGGGWAGGSRRHVFDVVGVPCSGLTVPVAVDSFSRLGVGDIAFLNTVEVVGGGGGGGFRYHFDSC